MERERPGMVAARLGGGEDLRHPVVVVGKCARIEIPERQLHRTCQRGEIEDRLVRCVQDSRRQRPAEAPDGGEGAEEADVVRGDGADGGVDALRRRIDVDGVPLAELEARHEAIEMRAAAGTLEHRRPGQRDHDGRDAAEDRRAGGAPRPPPEEHGQAGQHQQQRRPENDRGDHVTMVCRACCRCQRPVRRMSSTTAKASSISSSVV